MIYILTGDIRTGKTTALIKWAKERNDVDGLLCPDGSNGKRYFLKIRSETTFPLEVDQSTKNTISIGSFKFLESAFEYANDFLTTTATGTENTFVVIDELGKLELQGKGLHRAIINMVSDFEYKDHKHLILVVRKTLLKAIIGHYGMASYTIITQEDLAEKRFA